MSTEHAKLSEAFEKAVADQSYRAELVKNPSIAGVPGLKVYEDTASTMHLIVGVTDGVPEPAASLLAKAATDSAFKAKLMADPAGVAKMESNIDVPANLDIVILDNVPGQLYIVLPPAEMSGELNDMELEAVAGGKGGRQVGQAINQGINRGVREVRGFFQGLFGS